MDLFTALIVLLLGYFMGITTVTLAALYLEDKREQRSRRGAVEAFAKQFNVSMEEADAAVVTDPYWPR